MATLMLMTPIHSNTTYIDEKSRFWFHIAIFYILSSFKHVASQVMLCISSTLIIHEHDTKHYPSNMKIMQRLVIPLKEKDYKKVGHQAHDLHLKKKRGERWQEQKYKWRTCVFVYTCTWSMYLDSIAT